MSVIERRAHNILASDSKEFDIKHGEAFTRRVEKRKKELRLNTRRTNG